MAVKITNAFSRLEQRFEAKLALKTGWGRNEVLKLFREARREVIEELLDASVENDDKPRSE